MDQAAVTPTGPRELSLDALDLPAGEARRLFAWARRQGQPSWLWPDVAVADWRDALEGIEQVLRSVLTNSSSTPALDCEPNALGVACYTSGTGPLLGYWIEQGRVSAPPDAGALLGLHLRHNRIRMRKLTAEANALAAAFAGAGIECTLLKGMHTAHAYFPEPGTRPVADIDLLIDPARQEEAGEVMRAAGYAAGRANRRSRQQSWARADGDGGWRSLRLVHADDPWSVDLHASIDRRYAGGPLVARLDEVAGSCASDAWPVSGNARVLGQPLLLLHLAAHAASGFNSLSLMRLVELHLVIRRDRERGRMPWADFARAAERAEATGMIFPALRLCEDLVPGTVPERVLADCEAKVPPAVRRVVDPLTPASAQRVIRCSLAERFMWTGSLMGLVRQLLRDAFAPGQSFRDQLGIQGARMWRLARGTVSL